MYDIGDYVIYGKSGVCIVKDIGHPDMPGADETRLYYTLSPVYATETIFTPVDTSVFMRRAITRNEAMGLIEQIPAMGEGAGVPEGIGSRELPDYYRSLLGTHDCSDLLRLILTVYFRLQRAQKNRTKLCQTDQNFMRDAEDILYGELSVALDMPRDKVSDFIRETLEAKKKREA